MAERVLPKLGRRNFLRTVAVGAGALAIGGSAKTAAAASPAFVAQEFSDGAGRSKRPWWVKTVDKPTMEIDWKVMERYSEGNTTRGSMVTYVGKAEVDRYTAAGAKLIKERILGNVDGYQLRDFAMSAAHVGVGKKFLGPQTAPTPESRGVPKWTGTPEEASKMLRAAMRHFGAANCGFMELDDNTRKLIYSKDPDGKELIFTDEMKASETDKQRFIPKSCKYVMAYTVQMSPETMRRSPTMTGGQTTTLAYKRAESIQASVQEFLRGLGYQGLGESSTNALGIAPAFGVLTGLGEMSRLNRMISPEFGPMVRVFKLLMDLPVAVDKPIDAGIMAFCKACKKCAEACPSQSLSFDTEPTWKVRGPWNNPGHKAYFEDSVSCMTYWREKATTNCGICFGVCPFAKKDKAWIHEMVKVGMSVAPFADSFFRSMDDAFGYGAQASGESWWNLDLPEYGIDSSQPVGAV